MAEIHSTCHLRALCKRIYSVGPCKKTQLQSIASFSYKIFEINLKISDFFFFLAHIYNFLSSEMFLFFYRRLPKKKKFWVFLAEMYYSFFFCLQNVKFKFLFKLV